MPTTLLTLRDSLTQLTLAPELGASLHRAARNPHDIAVYDHGDHYSLLRHDQGLQLLRLEKRVLFDIAIRLVTADEGQADTIAITADAGEVAAESADATDGTTDEAPAPVGDAAAAPVGAAAGTSSAGTAPGTADERFPVEEHEQFEPAHS